MKADIRSLELFIGHFLRIGVVISGLLMLFGWISEISFTGDTFAQFHVYQERPLRPLLQALYQAQNWGALTAYAGLFVLISLPVVRVILTLIVFLKQRSYTLALISGLVFLGLVLSVALGVES